jgi:hypothetical protein|tara:strand:+ start:195 stop:914 length:720 start_codon:yes stop_codon:yes gene_type:complete
MNKKIPVLIMVIGVLLLIPSTAFGHKLIPTDGSNDSLENGLMISDHKISWAVYEEINDNELYYTFDGKKGDMFFASIVIPKIETLKNFSPSLAFIGYESHLELIQGYEIDNSNKNFPYTLPEGFDAYVFDYSGSFPSKEFYEPFGQITYWERQEITFDLPADGTYHLSVFDRNSNPGKYALAIGTIEDFSAYDFFTLLPYAWLATKLFVNDYFSAIIAIGIFIGILGLIIFGIYRKLRK